MRAPLRTLTIVVALTLATACTSGPPATITSDGLPACTPDGFTSVGEALPDCSFATFDGKAPLRLTALKGKPLVLNFWASWCIKCIEEMPYFQRVFADIGDRVTILGMDVLDLQGETREAARLFAARTKVRYPLAFDPQGLLYAHFSPSRERPIMPITVFVDGAGKVVERHFGPYDERALRAAVTKHLGVS